MDTSRAEWSASAGLWPGAVSWQGVMDTSRAEWSASDQDRGLVL